MSTAAIGSARNPDDALVATATKGDRMSWQATDAVWRTFDRKENAREFLMMLSMAHHYNEKLGRSFPSLETSTAELRCSRRWAIKLRSNLVAKGDIFVIEKGGGRGHPTVYALHPKYAEKMNSITSPFNTEKVNSCGRKGELSYARKGEQPARRNVHESNKTKKKASAPAASALALPPPPLLSEAEADRLRKEIATGLKAFREANVA